jgi:cold-inducible RNA-binding protein
MVDVPALKVDAVGLGLGELSGEGFFSDGLKPGSRERSGVLLFVFELYHMNNKLFVGNLSFNTTENDLQDAFSAHGSVTEANLMMDRMTGKSRGFAFVSMSTAEEAQSAINALNGSQMDGRALTVNVAKPREERAPSGGGGGGYRGGGGGGGDRGGSRNRY